MLVIWRRSGDLVASGSPERRGSPLHLTAGRVAVLAAVLYGLAVVSLQASGRLPLARAVSMVAAPAILALSAARPGWMLLAVLATPPGLLRQVPLLTPLALGAVLTATAVLRWPATSERSSGALAFAPLAVLLALSIADRAAVGSLAASAASQFRAELLLFAGTALITFVAVRDGSVSVRAIETSILVAVAGTAAIYLAQAGPHLERLTLWGPDAPADPGLLYHRTHFGYLAAMGFLVALSRSLLPERAGTRVAGSRVPAALVAAGFAAVTALSFTRGAWLASIAGLLLIAGVARRRGPWLLVPALALLIVLVPVARERVASDVEGGLAASIRSGSFGSGRAELWGALSSRVGEEPVAGHGFGYAWTLTPEDLFDAPDQFVSPGNPFVYAHNDVLFWALEFGAIGAALWLLWWAALARAAVWVLRRALASAGLTGVLLVMLVAETVDNGLFIRAIAVPAFAAAGALLALRPSARGSS